MSELQKWDIVVAVPSTMTAIVRGIEAKTAEEAGEAALNKELLLSQKFKTDDGNLDNWVSEAYLPDETEGITPHQSCSTQKVYKMPFGVQISTDEQGSGSISSELYSQFSADPQESSNDDLACGASDALESFLLALASEGVDCGDPRITEALKSAVNSIGNNL